MRYPKNLLLTTLALLTIAPAVRAEITAAAWIETYYLNPQPAALPRAIRQLSREGYFEKSGQASLAVGFIGTLFAQHPEHVDGWLLELNGLPLKTNRLLAAALWQAGHPLGSDLLRLLGQHSPLWMELERLADTPSQRIEDTPVQSASSMNLQWGAFLATGDERHIVRILDALGSGERALDTTARVAIAQHAASHPRVLEICERQLALQSGEVRGVLRAALAPASAKPRS